MKMLTLDKFEEASEKVKEVTLETKLVYSDYLSDQTGNKVYLKPENMQFTGAYKVRGAYYKISTLSEEERQRGLITASASSSAILTSFSAVLTSSSVSLPLLRRFLNTFCNFSERLSNAILQLLQNLI